MQHLFGFDATIHEGYGSALPNRCLFIRLVLLTFFLSRQLGGVGLGNTERTSVSIGNGPSISTTVSQSDAVLPLSPSSPANHLTKFSKLDPRPQLTAAPEEDAHADGTVGVEGCGQAQPPSVSGRPRLIQTWYPTIPNSRDFGWGCLYDSSPACRDTHIVFLVAIFFFVVVAIEVWTAYFRRLIDGVVGFSYYRLYNTWSTALSNDKPQTDAEKRLVVRSSGKFLYEKVGLMPLSPLSNTDNGATRLDSDLPRR